MIEDKNNTAVAKRRKETEKTLLSKKGPAYKVTGKEQIAQDLNKWAQKKVGYLREAALLL